jgi:outer membrane protein OmpA-like peptidoglycan-associated protein
MSLFRGRRSGRRNEGYDYWITATELMSAVMLVFVLIALIAMLRARREEDARAEVQRACKEVQESADALMSCYRKLADSELASEALGRKLATCERQNEAIMSSANSCAAWSGKHAAVKAAIEAFLLQAKLPSQGVEAGVVRIDAEVLFATNSAQLKESGKTKLREVIPMYAKVLADPEVSGAVKRVLIVGKSSRIGNDLENMRMSVLRAMSVYEFITKEVAPTTLLPKEFLRMLTPAGRGELDAEGSEDTNLPKDRSVELQIEFNLPDVQVASPSEIRRRQARELECDDRIDNDSDGSSDCTDADCLNSESCGTDKGEPE